MNTKMNIYIFEPSEKWSYCGGGIACIAPSYEEAIALFGKGRTFYKNEIDVPDDIVSDAWVLMGEFEIITNKHESEIIMCDENWA